MTTIADASNVDLNSPTTWAILGALLVLAACVLIREAVNRSPIHEPEPSRLDTLDGVGSHCSYDGCNQRVQIHLAVGHNDWWLFCLEHGTPYLTLRSDGAA